MKAYTAFPDYIVVSRSSGITEKRKYQSEEEAVQHGKEMLELGFTVNITVKSTLMGWAGGDENG